MFYLVRFFSKLSKCSQLKMLEAIVVFAGFQPPFYTDVDTSSLYAASHFVFMRFLARVSESVLGCACK